MASDPFHFWFSSERDYYKKLAANVKTPEDQLVLNYMCAWINAIEKRMDAGAMFSVHLVVRSAADVGPGISSEIRRKAAALAAGLVMWGPCFRLLLSVTTTKDPKVKKSEAECFVDYSNYVNNNYSLLMAMRPKPMQWAYLMPVNGLYTNASRTETIPEYDDDTTVTGGAAERTDTMRL